MSNAQPSKQNIFERTRRELGIGREEPVSKRGFFLCKTTIRKMYKILSDNHEWDIQLEDLMDYADALQSIRNCLQNFNESKIGPIFPFGKIISSLDQTKQYLGGALGIKNTYSPRRIKLIQALRTCLGNTLGQMEALERMKGFDKLPP